MDPLTIIRNRIENLTYRDEMDERSSFYGIVSYGELAFEPLVEAYESYDTEEYVNFWKHIARALVKVGGDKATDVFLRIIETEKNPYKRFSAAYGLSKLNDERAVQPLIDLLRTEVEHYAVETLRKIGDPKAFEPILKLFYEERIPPMHYLYLFTVAELGHSKAFETIFELLEIYKDVLDKQSVLMALGKTKDPRAYPILVEMLTNEEEVLRTGAAVGLGELGDKKAIEPLITSLADKTMLYTASKSLAALGCKGDTRVYSVLASHLSDPDVAVRAYAVFAFGLVGDQDAVPYLLPLLNDSESWILQETIGSLGRLRATQAIDSLKTFISRKTEYSTYAALALFYTSVEEGLKFLTQPDFRPLLPYVLDERIYIDERIEPPDEDGLRYREFDLSIIEPYKPQVINALHELLKATSQTKVKSDVIEALAKLKDEQTIREILTLSLQSEDSYLQSRARRALKQLGYNEDELK